MLDFSSKFHFGPLAKTFKQASYVIVDQNIYDLYKNHFENVEHLYIAPAGESCKNFKEVEKCLSLFLERGINRNSHIVVVGGGATSDFGGFVSSLLLRGIKWSVIPTTLLSMVDSSIGGKTGVNSPGGKNLIGSFHLPDNVWIDMDFLETLSQKEMENGIYIDHEEKENGYFTLPKYLKWKEFETITFQVKNKIAFSF